MNLPTTRTPSNRASQCFLAFFLVLLFSGAAHAATTWYVDADRPDDSGDGLSWATAKKSIQAAVIAAAENDLVLVAKGDYTPFIAGAAAITIRSVRGAEETIIDGDDAKCCAILGTELIASNTVLDGFTLKSGYAEKGGGAAYGILANCRLIDNAAEYGGGAHGCTLTNCILEDNMAEYDGGGAYQCTLEYCTLTKNEAKRPVEDEFFGRGGGAYECVLKHCILTENSAETGGGACQSNLSHCTLTKNAAKGYKIHDIAHFGTGGGTAHSILTNCTIADNEAVSGGAAFNCTLTSCVLTNNKAYDGGGAFSCALTTCILTNNSTSENGGGAYDCNLTNCLIAENDAAKGGGGTHGGTLINCTVAGNSAQLGGGGVSARSILKNCIVWGNLAPADANYSNSVLTFSCSEPLPDGEGNISLEPQFMDALAGNFHLLPESPCRDAGSNAFATGDFDLAGAPRISNDTIDMGAYEDSGFPFAIFVHLSGEGIVSPMAVLVNAGDSVTFTATETAFQFSHFAIDGVAVSESPVYTWENIQQSGVIVAVFGKRIWYVDATRPDDDGDATAWETAKKSIQAAVTEATNGDLVLVADGVYASIISDDKDIAIRSVHGAEATIIDGKGTERCAALGDYTSGFNTALNGFTLQNGKADNGGGALGGTLENCILTGNTAQYGGGASESILNN
ncbi:MAG TPA: choice-of-anchor Q domain-containing protein, partial [Lentisphaeria bacterium]|nr:choice-of-anchor Q domain-containing protein [Lentisphaeria bacterium]